MVCGTWADAERGMGVERWHNGVGTSLDSKMGKKGGKQQVVTGLLGICAQVCAGGRCGCLHFPFIYGDTINEKLANDSVLERGDLGMLQCFYDTS